MLNNSSSITLLILSIFLTISCKNPSQTIAPENADKNPQTWVKAIDSIEKNVYYLGLLSSSGEVVYQVGTGWAIDDHKIVTNAHVAYSLYRFCQLRNSTNIVAVQNKTFAGDTATYQLQTCSVHPGYNNTKVFCPDYAVLTVQNQLPGHTSPANDSIVNSLSTGQPIGMISFPGELADTLHNGVQPIGVFREGTISALKPFNQVKNSVGDNYNSVIQYNLDATGGSSGSPLFTIAGDIVGINNSGVEQIVENSQGNYVRIPIGSLSFGIRINEYSTMTSMPYEVNVSNFNKRPPEPDESLKSGNYRIKLSWDSPDSDLDLWLRIGKTHFAAAHLQSNKSYIYPFVVHHGTKTDNLTELATLTRLEEEVLIYAENFTSENPISESGANSTISNFSSKIAKIENPPQGKEDIWMIGKLTPQGQFQKINKLQQINPININKIRNIHTVLNKSSNQNLKIIKETD